TTCDKTMMAFRNLLFTSMIFIASSTRKLTSKCAKQPLYVCGVAVKCPQQGLMTFGTGHHQHLQATAGKHKCASKTSEPGRRTGSGRQCSADSEKCRARVAWRVLTAHHSYTVTHLAQ
ncbi:unnamed protein product, partial [Ceratitis capitata]